MSTDQTASGKERDTERESFEAKFPVPSDCQWTGNGYSATEYNAWDAHKHIERWEGWNARAQLAAPAPEAGLSDEELHAMFRKHVVQAENRATIRDLWLVYGRAIEALVLSRRLAPAEPAPAGLPAWWGDFILNVCEIPDRNSPEDEPEAMVATAEELENCALSAIESSSAPSPAAEAPIPPAVPAVAVEPRRKWSMADAVAWANRHDIRESGNDLMCMFEDAATLHLEPDVHSVETAAPRAHFKIGVFRLEDPDLHAAVQRAIADAHSKYGPGHIGMMSTAAIRAVFDTIKEPMTPTETDESLRTK